MTFELGLVPMMSNPYFLYQIQLQGERRVYMRAIRTRYLNEERLVVIVDAEAFWESWRAADDGSSWSQFTQVTRHLARCLEEVPPATKPTTQQSGVDDADSHRKKKFAEAVDGFECGIYNAVPLAEVSCGRNALGRACINFTNGITRTLYLLQNGARTFPVLCDGTEQAEQLHKMCGVSGRLPKTVEELAPPGLCSTAYVIENGFFDAQTREFDRFKLVRERWGEEAWWHTDRAASREKSPSN